MPHAHELKTRSVRNRTRGAVLHDRPVWARTLLQMATGLMFRKPRDECLVFLFLPPRREVITMWFVFAPIDAIALDGEGKVVAAHPGLRPWRKWVIGEKVSAVVELPAGTLARTGTVVGDHVSVPPLTPDDAFWSWWHYALFLLVQVCFALAIIACVFLLLRLL